MDSGLVVIILLVAMLIGCSDLSEKWHEQAMASRGYCQSAENNVKVWRPCAEKK